MKRFYFQVNSPDGIADIIIRHKSVKNENEAKERLFKKYGFSEDDILRLSEQRLPTDYTNFSTESYKSLIYFVQELIYRKYEGVNYGSI